jgi:hypothetical protein
MKLACGAGGKAGVVQGRVGHGRLRLGGLEPKVLWWKA